MTKQADASNQVSKTRGRNQDAEIKNVDVINCHEKLYSKSTWPAVLCEWRAKKANKDFIFVFVKSIFENRN